MTIEGAGPLATDVILFAAAALVVSVLWFWLVAHSKRIERRLDQEHDYFRYIDRGNAWVGPRTLDWLLDFLRKYRTLGYADPILDRLVTQCKIAWTIWAGAVFVWLVGAAVWIVIS